MEERGETGRRFLWLDSARGLAALGVVVWHWQHFLGVHGPAPLVFRREVQPFYALLFALYEHGQMAVDFFFLLSGFVFFWGQKAAIEDGRLGGRDFFWRRFSRLYPLHFATLLLVAGLQAGFWQVAGRSFVYDGNDLSHFLLHLGFAQSWFSDWGSFNGPTWSVSIEVVLYAGFYALAASGALKRVWVVPALLLLGVVAADAHPAIARGLIGFFMGGLVCGAWARLRSRPAWILGVLGTVAGSGWVLTLVQIRLGMLDPVVHAGFLPSGLLPWICLLGLFPLSVLVLALADVHRPLRAPILSRLGDISYAAYLLHFPLQLTVALASVAWGLPDLFRSELGFVAFFGVLILLSNLTYHGFERPMQTWIRDRALGRRAVSSPTSAAAPGVAAG